MFKAVFGPYLVYCLFLLGCSVAPVLWLEQAELSQFVFALMVVVVGVRWGRICPIPNAATAPKTRAVLVAMWSLVPLFALIALLDHGVLTVFAQDPHMAFMALAIAVCISVSYHLRPFVGLGSLFFALGGFVVAVFGHYGLLTLDLLLVTWVFLALCCVTVSLLLPSDIMQSDPSVFATCLPISAPVLFAIFAPTDSAVIFLAAWLFCETAKLVFNGLRVALFDELMAQHRTQNAFGFAATAARANLGMMLIGGSTLLILLAILKAMPTDAAIVNDDFATIALWLTLAQAGGVIFGEANLLLTAAAEHRRTYWMALFWAPVFVAAVVFCLPSGPVAVAKAVAFVSLASHAHTALIVVKRFGVWPGVTAMFQKELRLT